MKMDRHFGQSRILVVDEQTLLAETIAIAIGLTGRTAHGRSHLSGRLLPQDFDILIVDPNLKSLEGAKGLAKLRQKLPKMRIVFLHDHYGDNLPDDVTLGNADALLTRTMSAEALLVLINTLEGIDLLQANP